MSALTDNLTGQPTLSVVVPCFNEEAVIVVCHERLTAVLQGTGETYEIVYVDDGSHDRTAEMLQELHAHDAHIVVLRLSRNFGHQPAVSAGLDRAQGQAVVIIDADLQDPPELIPAMMALWRSGYQVVYGVRESRAGESRFKLWSARLFYRSINRLAEIEIPFDTGDFRLIDAAVRDVFRRMPERHRLLRGMSSWIGFNQIGLKYEREARFAGQTKYPLRKMLTLAVDGIVSFSILPLRFVTMIGFAAAGVSLAGILYTIVIRLFTHSWVRGWAMSFIGMLFMSGAQMLSIGVLGEYIGRIYTESKQRPLYVLRETLDGPSARTYVPADQTKNPEASRERLRS